jgi:RNA polymerase sigma factor (sigma-70 family)
VDFDAVWPSARTQLTNVLRSRGVQPADVDDIVQDVAVRALKVPRRFESEEHLVAWCCRVGINLHIDATRRQRRVVVEAPPDPVATHDTAATVERRMALEILADGIADLSDDEKRLLFELERTDSRKEAVRLAVRRHRLRARLATLVEGLAAIVGLVRGLSRFTSGLSKPAKVSLAAAPVVAAGLVLGPLAIGGGAPGAPATLPTAVIPLRTTVPAPAGFSGSCAGRDASDRAIESVGSARDVSGGRRSRSCRRARAGHQRTAARRPSAAPVRRGPRCHRLRRAAAWCARPHPAVASLTPAGVMFAEA